MVKPVKKWKKVPLEVSMHMRVLYQEFGWRICDMQQKFPHVPRRTLSYHANLVTTGNQVDKRKFNKGRPRKLNARDRRKLKLCIDSIRQYDNPNFTMGRLQNLSGLQNDCSSRTITRAVHEMGIHYLNTRQKGLMSRQDHTLRLAFARKCIDKYGPEIWTSRVSMYYDAVAFYHKVDPYSQAISPKKKVWRKRCEGLQLTSKGKKEGNNGRRVKMFVSISHSKGVVMCEQWDPKVKFNGENYKKFVIKYFPDVLQKCSNARNKLVLQDGDPVQKSKQANMAYDKVGCKIFSIPPRSPDMNPIENMFNQVRKQLASDAIEQHIRRETYQEFAVRVKRTIEATPIAYIDRTIESLPGRMEMVIDKKGFRIRY